MIDAALKAHVKTFAQFPVHPASEQEAEVYARMAMHVALRAALKVMNDA